MTHPTPTWHTPSPLHDTPPNPTSTWPTPPHPYMTHPTPAWHTPPPLHDPPHPTLPLHDPPHPTPAWHTPPPCMTPPHPHPYPYMTHPTPPHPWYIFGHKGAFFHGLLHYVSLSVDNKKTQHILVYSEIHHFLHRVGMLLLTQVFFLYWDVGILLKCKWKYVQICPAAVPSWARKKLLSKRFECVSVCFCFCTYTYSSGSHICFLTELYISVTQTCF